ncbi:DMT family transporter [Terasakiella sp. A23]|uniref:DMT family transporter n=1 Tax=Terasakiella sp. FCG-A23 TaxID=3080561 RepID=UPI002955C831|nr:DMT family transporter [Terasakiella sp. A23]MDV7341479.1 DMT family transporter [Terasakiella sp. A23]
MNDQNKGIAYAVLAAISLGFITTFARLAYDAGFSPLTLIVLRALISAALVFLLVLVLRTPVYVPKDIRLNLLSCGIGITMISFGYLSAVAFIPVGLAAIIYYTFPIMVIGIEALQERKAPPVQQMIVFLFAFVGLVFVIGPGLDVLDWRGIACSLIGAVGTVIVFVSGRKLGAKLAPKVTVAYTNILVACVGLLAVVVVDNFQLPHTSIGWWALGGVVLTYVIGIVAHMFAVKHAKASIAALVFNMEPLVSIMLGWIILNETLSLIQMAGVAIVIFAISCGARIASD